MKKAFCLLVIGLWINVPGNGQVYFPFKTEDKQSSILAYWYNCKPDSVTLATLNETFYFQSTLQLYGPVISDSFYVKVEVFLPDGIMAYTNNFLIRKDAPVKNYQVDVINNYFRIMSSVDQLSKDPDKIKVTIYSSDRHLEKWIFCKYHKIYGHMTDFSGNPLRSFISVKPDAFEDVNAVWSNADGYYEISLPERTYNNFYVNDGNYRSTTLEAWSWHMIVDEDQEIDYKIGTGEVYNLTVWPNNGGYNSLLLSFRPMVLGDRSKTKSKQIINDKEFNLNNIAPELDIKDMNITINGKQAEIYSIQKYFETGQNISMCAYLVQIRRLEPTFGKQTIRVEYNKTVEQAGKKIFQNSMGYFQLYVNFSGKSAFN
ncbi:MAG: hypothetical protein LLG13_14785 [Bacteroidales bacterium]|nr:hypothetical protein [Bacteroidales bacterium]